MDALCKCMFIIIETIVNSMKIRPVSKVIDVFQKNLFMSIRRMKNKYKVPIRGRPIIGLADYRRRY